MNLLSTALAPAAAGPSAGPAPATAAQDPAQDVALAGAAAAPFAQWLAVGELAVALAADPLGANAKPDTPAGDAGQTATDDSTPDASAALPQDGAMLAAMAMPLMTAAPAPAPAAASGADLLAVGGAAPARVSNEDSGNPRATAAPVAVAAAAMQQPIAAAAPAVVQAAAAGALAAAQPRAGSAQRSPGQAPAPASSFAPSAASSMAAAPMPSLAPSPAPAAAPSSAADSATAASTAAGDAGGAGDKPDAAPAATGTGWGVGAPTAAAANARPADTLALAGPPTAWRQTLHEALGERLQMQVGNKLEQAVIRLDPPNLGRIEIAIRHSAGALEVTLSATHSEVVRQLHTVSDSLRNDLAQRQYSEVAVTVSQAPRAQQAGPGAFADQQGRGRQGGREQEESAPGLALADAANPTSTFSLNGRE